MYKPNSNTPLTAKVERYHENGQLSVQGKMKNGEEDGPFRLYYENGQLSSQGMNKNGSMEGIWEFFNKDGSLEKTETYLEGKVLE